MARILVVDDEPEIVVLTEKILEKEGHEVISTRNGLEFMEILKSNKPDLILLDIMMPEVNGWEVCRKIKSNVETRDIPVVMFTVRTSEDSVEKSFEYAHADAQIGKPFKAEEIIETIERLVKQSKAD
jgi:twitching motility two-component system response regulator PilG